MSSGVSRTGRRALALVALFAAMSLSVVSPSSALANKSKNPLTAYRALQKDSSKPWQVVWDSTGLVQRVHGGAAAGATSARDFIGKYGALFAVDGSAISVEQIASAAKNKYTAVTFQAQHQGIALLDGTVEVTSDDKGRVVEVTSGCFPVDLKNIKPGIDARRVEEIVARVGDKKTYTSIQAPRLVIARDAGGRLAYDVHFRIQRPGVEKPSKMRAVVDAHSGSVMLLEQME